MTDDTTQETGTAQPDTTQATGAAQPGTTQPDAAATLRADTLAFLAAHQIGRAHV